MATLKFVNIVDKTLSFLFPLSSETSFAPLIYGTKIAEEILWKVKINYHAERFFFCFAGSILSSFCALRAAVGFCVVIGSFHA